MMEILTFVDTITSEGTNIAEITAEIKQHLVADVVGETEMKDDTVLQMVRQLNRLGSGIREQCNLFRSDI